MYVSWESFTDVEEYKTSVHSYGLPMQSVPITTDVVNSNLDQGEVYNIMS
jgi:hypothetical protein